MPRPPGESDDCKPGGDDKDGGLCLFSHLRALEKAVGIPNSGRSDDSNGSRQVWQLSMGPEFGELGRDLLGHCDGQEKTSGTVSTIADQPAKAKSSRKPKNRTTSVHADRTDKKRDRRLCRWLTICVLRGIRGSISLPLRDVH